MFLEAFERLSHERRSAIINGAMACFGKTGYRKTSVADVAAAAGISKAAVFHYFGSKKELYLYLCEFARDKIMLEFSQGSDDFFECLILATDVKMRVMAEYPPLNVFLSSIAAETEQEVLSELERRVESSLAERMPGFFFGVDWSRLKPGIGPERLHRIVSWVSNGYIRDNVGKKSGENMRREIYEYYDMLKRAFYREEFLTCALLK